ncbi:MAG TPA: glycosyltransferase family 4 protein [Chthoniobacteraceae bacterium]|nr:glycosyltransferase family 4 protein [Chthoniobacteraceae bacterium]
MKVAHLCNLPLLEDHPDFGRIPTHPGRWVLNIARAQAQFTDIQPELVVQMPGTTKNYDGVIDGIPVHYVAAPDVLRSATLFFFDARRLARRVAELRPDVVHAHGTEDAYGLAAQRSGRPCIITAQGLYFLINQTTRPRFVSRARIVQWAERRCFQHARHVIAKSEYVRAHLAAKFPHLVFHHIPNTFDTRLLEVQEAREKGVVVFVGTMSLWKGVHFLREAMVEVKRHLPQARLWIVGDRPESPGDYERAEKQALFAALGESVTFHGTRPFLETAALIARASVLAAPSIQDMFGNQVIEALLLGTPVVTVEGTAMPENVRRFGNGVIVREHAPRQLADALISVLQNPPPVDEAQSAREKVVAFMQPQRVAELHAAAYRAIRVESGETIDR